MYKKKTKTLRIPLRYLPNKLTSKDKQKQLTYLKKSRKLYKKHIYYSRPKIPSFTNKVSPHIKKAMKIYKIKNMTPNKALSVKTGCSLNALRKIINKGEGAYYSSGSRPNQSARSWGLARLASSVTGGKAAAVDFSIIEKGCKHNKKAYKLALTAKQKYKSGHSATKKINIKQ